MARISGLSSYPGLELSGSNFIENRTPITKGNGNLVRVSGSSSYPEFEFVLYTFCLGHRSGESENSGPNIAIQSDRRTASYKPLIIKKHTIRSGNPERERQKIFEERSEMFLTTLHNVCTVHRDMCSTTGNV